MAEACSRCKAMPNEISFKDTIQLLNHFMPRFFGMKSSERAGAYRILLSKIVLNRIGNRPGRIEPRAVKRRQKSFPRLNDKRKIEREKIIKKQKNLHQLGAA